MSKYKLPHNKTLNEDSAIEDVDERLAKVSGHRITGWDHRADNYRRARTALKGLGTFAEETGLGGEGVGTVIGDHLNNLQHLLDVLGVDMTVAELAEAKSYHYEAEIDGVL